VQNAGSQQTCLVVHYYNANGTEAIPNPAPPQMCIRPGESTGAYLPNIGLPAGFQGSAVVTANQPLAAVVNANCTAGCNSDTVYAYNGVNRWP
jgi:hypothetical protein